jgi:FMN-binding domain
MKFNFNFGSARTGAWLLAAGLLCPAVPAGASVVMTEAAALERAFPGLHPGRRTLYLTEDQKSAIEKLARSHLPSLVVTMYEAELPDGAGVKRGYLDTNVVRTMPETVLTVVKPDGTLAMALVLQFSEPPDFLPQERWLTTLEGKPLDAELWPGRGVRRVTGATLTVQAITEAVRRGLAIDQVVRKQP